MGGLLLGGRAVHRLDADRQSNAMFSGQRISAARQFNEQNPRRKARLSFTRGDTADGGLIHTGLLGKVALAEALAL